MPDIRGYSGRRPYGFTNAPTIGLDNAVAKRDKRNKGIKRDKRNKGVGDFIPHSQSEKASGVVSRVAIFPFPLF